jgi:hypothetical protein
MSAKLRIELVLGEQSGDAIAATLPSVDAPQLAANVLANLLGAVASGTERGRLRVAVDEHAGVAAAVTLVATGANIAAAEYIEFVTPVGRFRVTAVASGAADGDKTFNVSATDNTVATNIRQAINTHPQLLQWVSASGGTNNVIVTARKAGTWGNSLVAVDGTVNGITGEGSFAGGLDPSARAAAQVTCVAANTDADDTLVIGKTTLTAKAGDASGESQFNIGASNAAMATNLAACINAHTAFAGIMTAAVESTNVVRITYQCDARLAEHIRLTSSDADGIVLTAQPTSGLTTANEFATRSYGLGEGTS